MHLEEKYKEFAAMLKRELKSGTNLVTL